MFLKVAHSKVWKREDYLFPILKLVSIFSTKKMEEIISVLYLGQLGL